MNVIPFPHRPIAFIDCGTVTESPISSEVGAFRYFVFIEEGGTRNCLWDGSSYGAGLGVLDVLRSEGVPVFDRAIGRLLESDA